MAELIYIDKVPVNERRDFTIKVLAVAKLLQINPDWLMQIFKSESGVRADIRNTYAPFYKNGQLDGYATGLIQFIPSTARGLGTTTYLLEKMTRLQQLDYVYKYLQKYTGRLHSYFDLYLVVFFPAAIPYSNNDNWVFEVKNISRSAVAKANPAIDMNKDGKITMGEFKAYIRKTVPAKYQAVVFGTANPNITLPPGTAEAGGGTLGILLMLGLLAAFK